jgi:transcriptional regulator of acetoin/glycerol metabolism
MRARPLSTQGLPSQPFFQTPEQRAALARQRYFEEGSRPSGLVSESVLQSWARSGALGHQQGQRPAVDPVSRSSLSAALGRNRELLHAANTELHALEDALAGTACRVLLTDAAGVIVHVSRHTGESGQQVLDQAVRLGVNLCEGQVGTTAPGIVVHTGMASTVQAGEHYYDAFQDVRCAAAPIRDVRGQLVGVLDLSTESRGFAFDAASVVGVFATSIENRLLQAQARDQLVLHFQTAPSLLGTPLEGLAGVCSEGKLVWINATGRSLLGNKRFEPADAHELLGVGLVHLLGLCRSESAQWLRLPSGLGIWVRAMLNNGDGVNFQHAVALGACPVRTLSETAVDSAPCASRCVAPVPEPVGAGNASLAQTHQRLIDATLQANGGNVAKTARQLGVSRGLLYRHLRKAGECAPD